MCLEILTKRNEAWVLRYVPDSKALTDPPEKVIDLMRQRRRWMNGSLFAAIYCILNFCKITHSNHGYLRIIAIYLFFAYYLLYVVFLLLMAGISYSTIKILLLTHSEIDDICEE